MRKKLCVWFVLICILFVSASVAEETDVHCMVGVVTAAEEDSVTVRWENGQEYAFAVLPDTDLSGLTGEVTAGRVVTVFFEGEIDWEKGDTLDAAAEAITDGTLDYPYGIVTEENELKADCDGDGIAEALRFTWREHEEFGALLTLHIGDAEYDSDILCSAQAIVCDLDPEDGRLDVLLTGDVMSDDYVTYRLQYDGSGIGQMGEAINGAAQDYSDGFVTVGCWVDVLGTHWGESGYALNEEGVLAACEDSEWIIDESGDEAVWEAYAISPIADLPVTILDEDGEHEGVIPAGTALHIVGTDRKTTAYFETEDGVYGFITISPSQKGWGLDVNGQDESVYFADLPYAG